MNSLIYAEIEAQDKVDFAYDNLVLAIDGLSSDEFTRLPKATQLLVQNMPFLALIILENSRLSNSNNLLAKASALRLDGALSEEYTCAILRRGKSILSAMKQLRATLKDASLSCEKDARRLHVDPPLVCAEPSIVARRVDALITALGKGRRCK